MKLVCKVSMALVIAGQSVLALRSDAANVEIQESTEIQQAAENVSSTVQARHTPYEKIFNCNVNNWLGVRLKTT